MEGCPPEILDLVERFDQNRDSYLSPSFNETELRVTFANPFFEALGWDVHNKRGHAEAYKDVVHEDAIRVGGATKAPDYCFRIGGARKFFVETKKPAVQLSKDPMPAYQLRRYAWSAKLPLSVLTDFEEFALYDCRVRPSPSDKPTKGRVLHCRYEDYPTRWKEIAGVLSKDAVLRGDFDRYVTSTKKKRGTAEVDDAFLAEIEKWRGLLARNFALRNKLSVRELNYAVACTIDRIIFLRMCEDRGVEHYGQLQGLLNGQRVYRRLFELFEHADDRYNSGLFHFHAERGRTETPDELTPKLKLDDKPLKQILRGLYYPDSPYEFAVLPADVLGQVYEQFLGKVIRLTRGGQAKVEDKPEVKKAGGVYYTPTYIVDYIVKNTVGKLLEGKTLRQARKLRILDPACGSGSFLVAAYQFLLDWHRDRYLEEGPEKHRKVLYQGRGKQWLLTTGEKKRILLDNIHGVDIDPQAVEVTKLSLLLKVLEGATREVLENQRRLFHERALPDLSSNVKCGNSLIGPDFYDGRQMSLLDDDEHNRINAFDWKAEFPKIMKSGGFDAVIGNPPWGAAFSTVELDYLRTTYRRVIARMVDSYIYFLDRALTLSRPSGLVGFIIPSTLLNQVDAREIRRILLNRGVQTVINLGRDVFSRKVLNTSTILITSTMSDNSSLFLADLSHTPSESRDEGLADVESTEWRRWKLLVERDPYYTYFVGQIDHTCLLQRMRDLHPTVGDFVDGRIQRGVSPDVAAAFVVSREQAESEGLELELLRPSISGSQIKRYQPWQSDQLLIYTNRETRIRDYPRTLHHLERFKNQNTCKEAKSGKHPWWSLHRPRNPTIFKSPKLIGLTTTKTIELIYDESASLFVTDAMYIFHVVHHCDPLVYMAVMQSTLFLLLYRTANQGESRVIPQIKAAKLSEIPFPELASHKNLNERLAAAVARIMRLYADLKERRTPDQVTRLRRQTHATDRQIDQLVYELYGLTDEEIALVEDG